jgi:uncharacterized protein
MSSGASPEDNVIGRIFGYARTVAIVGASSNPSRPSNDIATYLAGHGFQITPVNPNEREVAGVPAVGTLAELECAPGVVNVFRRSSEVVAVALEAVAIGARALWMQPGAENREAADIASAAGMDVVSGSCIMVQHRLWTARQHPG